MAGLVLLKDLEVPVRLVGLCVAVAVRVDTIIGTPRMVEYNSTHPFTNGDGVHPLFFLRPLGRLPYTPGGVASEGGHPLSSLIKTYW